MEVFGGWIDVVVGGFEGVGLVSVCEGVFSVGFGPGLDSCLPQGGGTPPATLRRRTAGIPKKLGGLASGEAR